MYDLYRAIMDYCNEQDPEAMIIFGGDACDRGKDGYKIMRELLNNPRIVYLKGNHEDMFVKAARQIKNEVKIDEYKDIRSAIYWCSSYDYRYEDIRLSIMNGGLTTLVDWTEDGMDMEFVDKIDKLPLTFSTDVCDFCHAAGVYQTFERAANAEYNGLPVDKFDAESLAWTRSGFNVGWAPNRIAVFGHTPVPYLGDYMDADFDENVCPQPYKWVGDFYPKMTGAKIDMDTGACFTGNAYVLNVLTMKAQGFEDTDINSEEIHKHDIKKIDCVQM